MGQTLCLTVMMSTGPCPFQLSAPWVSSPRGDVTVLGCCHIWGASGVERCLFLFIIL